jgi:hypothetical protein
VKNYLVSCCTNDSYMRYYFVLSFLGIGISGWAQQISPSVNSSGGNTFQNGSVSMDFTIGEPLTNSYQNGALLLTQGFHQPIISLVNVPEWQEADIQLYPNPSSSKLTLSFPDDSYDHLTIYDAQGKLLFTSALSGTTFDISVDNWAKGAYKLVITGIQSKQLSFIKE